jgi:hypothetical protein
MTRFYLAGKPISGVVMRVDCKVVMREAVRPPSYRTA